MKIHVSMSTKILLEKTKKFKIVERGTVELKGKGEMKTYFVECKLDEDGKSIELPYSQVYEDYDLVKEDDKYDKKGAGFKLLGEEENNKNEAKTEINNDLSKIEIQNSPTEQNIIENEGIFIKDELNYNFIFNNKILEL